MHFTPSLCTRRTHIPGSRMLVDELYHGLHHSFPTLQQLVGSEGEGPQLHHKQHLKLGGSDVTFVSPHRVHLRGHHSIVQILHLQWMCDGVCEE